MIYWKRFKTNKIDIKISNKGDVEIIKWNKHHSDDIVKIIDGRKRIGSHNYYYVYKLVDYVFRGPLPKGYCVHHINFDKSDDRLSNLLRIPISEHIKLHAQHNRELNIKKHHKVEEGQFSISNQKKIQHILKCNELDMQSLEMISNFFSCKV